MESAHLGLVLDSSVAIAAERRKQPIAAFIEAILATHGPVDLSFSPVTVAELVHGVFGIRLIGVAGVGSESRVVRLPAEDVAAPLLSRDAAWTRLLPGAGARHSVDRGRAVGPVGGDERAMAAAPPRKRVRDVDDEPADDGQ